MAYRLYSPVQAKRIRLKARLHELGVVHDPSAETEDLVALLLANEPPRMVWMRYVWQGLKVAAGTVAFMGALSFGSFIFEESIQTAGFSVKVAIDARDATVAAACLKTLCGIQATASSYQHFVGWLCFWMNRSYLAYFDRATPAQIAADYTLGVRLGLWSQADGRTITASGDSWSIDNAIRHADDAAAHTEQGSLRWLVSEPIETNTTRVAIFTPQVTMVETQLVRRAAVAAPDAAFWRKWREDKESMQADGYSLTKTTNGWRVTKVNR